MDVLAPALAPVRDVPALVPVVGDDNLTSQLICLVSEMRKPRLARVKDKLINLRASFSNLKKPHPGLYHYQREGVGERSRIHLRIEADGSGFILVNANRVMHLNPTAALMAYLALEGNSEQQAIQAIRRAYQVPPSQAHNDYAQFVANFNELVRPNGACPIHDMELDVITPFSARPSAPYRMDLALTYRCNNDCAHCYNARPRDFAEISTNEWKKILDNLWDIGIPHIVFTGGESTLRVDLPELIAHAEQNGQITGLNTNGRRLSNMNFVRQLVDAGLDHVQITVESHDADIHDNMVKTKGAWKQTISGLRNVLDTPLFVMTNTTMLQDNSPVMAGTLDYLAELGVPTIGLNALIYAGRGLSVGRGLPENDLLPILEMARGRTAEHNQRLIWYTPTQYCNFDPMQLELGVKGCTAALYNMCVEPDGSVIPCQSYYQSLGNILVDPWETIWGNELSISLRERHQVPERCSTCVLLSECGGGCPLQHQISQ